MCAILQPTFVRGLQCKFSFDSQIQDVGSSNFTTFTDDTDLITPKSRCDSLQSSFGAHSPTMSKSQVGRRRGSDSAEPGSARAVYLEKNRKAASKCRSKQKRQQEELIETARDVERRNKIGSSSEEWDAGSDASRWPAHKVF